MHSLPGLKSAIAVEIPAGRIHSNLSEPLLFSSVQEAIRTLDPEPPEPLVFIIVSFSIEVTSGSADTQRPESFLVIAPLTVKVTSRSAHTKAFVSFVHIHISFPEEISP